MALRGARFRGSRVLSHAAVVLGVLAGCAAAPGVAAASPDVGHVRTDASVPGGLIAPGNTISLLETINNSGDPLTGASGLLTSTTPGVTVDQGSSAYPNLTFSQEGANTTPFGATVDSSVPCGTPLAFSLQVNGAGSYSHAVPFTVPTGIGGPATSYDAADLPTPIPDNPGNVSSSLSATGTGLARGITVRLGQIDHTYVGDLKIELIAPDDTTSVVLVNRKGGDGNNFTNTVLSDSAGQSITSASAPFTGTYRPEEPLSKFDGQPLAGTWKLKVSDQSNGDTGVIKSWGADIAPAVCSDDPVAGFTVNPSPAPPGAAVTFDASGSVEPKPGETITNYGWDFGDGTPHQDTGTPTISHSYTGHGLKQVTLVVTDTAGHASLPKTVPLIVTQPPTVSLGASPNPVQDAVR